MNNILIEVDFEFNLNFEGLKSPSEAFNQMARMYDRFLSIDKHVLYNILPTARIEYELIDIEFSSIKSKVIQWLTAVPDEVLKEIASPKKLFGIALVAIKYKILKAVENNEIQCRENLEKLTNSINKEIKQLPDLDTIKLEVNNYFVLNSVNEIVKESRKLKPTESYDFRCSKGNAHIKNNAHVNMAKILFELGDQQFEQQRIETLKVKSLDLLSDRASWNLIRQGKKIEVKILDKEWLSQYHNRLIVIQPNDYLKIELKIIYSKSNNSVNPTVNYEALKVYQVIPPENIESDNQLEIF